MFNKNISNKRNAALILIAIAISLIAYSTAQSTQTTSSTSNSTNFTLNLSGQPAMDNFSTIVCGVNMTCSQNSTPDNHTIFINSLGAGGGSGSGTVTQLNQGTGIKFSTNPITTTGTISANATICNPANQASVLNSSGGFECVDNTDSVGITVETDPNFTNYLPGLVNVTNQSYVIRNQTWSRQNTTIDKNISMENYSIENATNIKGIQLVGMNLMDGKPFFFPNDPKEGLGSDYVAQFVSEGNAPIILYTGISSDHVFDAPSFTAIRGRGNLTYLRNLSMGDAIFAVGGRGISGSGGNFTVSSSSNLTPTRIAMHFVATQHWNGTAQGTKINFYTTKNDTTSAQIAMTVNDDKSVTFPKLAGNNKNITCHRADGTQYSGKIDLSTGTCDY